MSYKTNNKGEILYHVGMTDDEMSILIDYIDEKEVNEDLLLGVRRKMVHKRALLRKRQDADSTTQPSQRPQQRRVHRPQRAFGAD